MMHCFLRRRWAPVATILLSSTALVGCSLIDPYVAPDEHIQQRYSEERSLDAAIKYAEALRDEYKGAISDQAILNSSVGLALIPVSALAAYYGITGGHSNTIVGLALGGAGAYIGASYLHSEPRQFVYASGVTAVNCAISIMEPFRTAQIALQADGGSLTPRLAAMERTANGLQILIQAALKTTDPQDPEIVAAQDAVNTARTMSAEGRAVEVALKSSGGTLFSSVRQIEATVDRAIIDTEPSLSSLVSTLGTALPLRAGQIAPQPKPKEKAQGKATGAADANTQDLLIKARQQLEGEIIAVREIVDLVKDRTPAESLQNCGVDISKAGLTFNVIPEVPVTFVDSGAQETSTISVRGGQPPYAATWVGTTPTDIAATLAPSPNWDETGVLTVSETTGNTAPGTYSLLIHDAGIGATIIEVTSSNTGTRSSGSAREEPVAVAPVVLFDPEVEKVQRLLARDGSNPGKIDGIFGPDTVTAIRSHEGNPDLTEVEARARIPKIILELEATLPPDAGAPADTAPDTGTAPAPGTGDASGATTGQPTQPPQEGLMERAFRALGERGCLPGGAMPTDATALRKEVTEGTNRLLASQPTLVGLGFEEMIDKIEMDPGLVCTAQ
jgi:hypothetical protein